MFREVRAAELELAGFSFYFIILIRQLNFLELGKLDDRDWSNMITLLLANEIAVISNR